MGLFNYYYSNITNKSELNFDYYLLKYSCVRTRAHIQKVSVKKSWPTAKYGNNLKIEYQISQKYKSGNITIKRKYLEIILQKALLFFLFFFAKKKKTEKT
jgi:hypothetical protein